jgi:hypothetical protein
MYRVRYPSWFSWPVLKVASATGVISLAPIGLLCKAVGSVEDGREAVAVDGPEAPDEPGGRDSESGREPESTEGRDAALAGMASGASSGMPPSLSQPDLLREMAALRRQARTARHAYWFPLVLFGLLTCASFPFYLPPSGRRSSTGAAILASPVNPAGRWLPFFGGAPGVEQGGLGYYWLAALLGGLAATLLWYRWHARRAGLATPAWGYLISTVVVTMAALAIPPLSLVRSPRWLRFLHELRLLWPGDLIMRGAFPFLIIAAGLLILAWAERSRALAITAAVCIPIALLESLYDLANIAARLGWNPPLTEEPLLNVLPSGLFLLLAGTAAFVWQRRRRTSA